MRRGEYEAIDLTALQIVDDDLLGLLVVGAVRENRDEAVRAQRTLDAAHDGRKDRVTEIGNQHADREAAARAQARRQGIPPVAQLLGNLEHFLRQLVRHHGTGGRIQHARYGGGMDARATGHVLAPEAHPAARRPQEAVEVPHERRLAAAVAAHDRDRLAAADREIDGFQRHDAGGIPMGDALEHDVRGAAGCPRGGWMDGRPLERRRGRRGATTRLRWGAGRLSHQTTLDQVRLRVAPPGEQVRPVFGDQDSMTLCGVPPQHVQHDVARRGVEMRQRPIEDEIRRYPPPIAGCAP